MGHTPAECKEPTIESSLSQSSHFKLNFKPTMAASNENADDNSSSSSSLHNMPMTSNSTSQQQQTQQQQQQQPQNRAILKLNQTQS